MDLWKKAEVEVKYSKDVHKIWEQKYDRNNEMAISKGFCFKRFFFFIFFSLRRIK